MKLPRKKVKQLIDLMNSKSEASLLRVKQLEELIELAMDEEMLEYLLVAGKEDHTKEELKEIYLSLYPLKEKDWDDFFDELMSMCFFHNISHEQRDIYGLTPIFPGWVEFYTSGQMNDKRAAIIKKFMEFYELMDEFNRGPMHYILNQHNLNRLKKGRVPRFSTLCAHPKEIELNRPLTSEPAVILTGDVYELLKKHKDEIAVMHCFCRNYKKLTTGEDCSYNVPTEACFTVGALARQLIDTKVGRKLEFEEAVEMLNTFQKNGCIHSTYHFRNNADLGEIAICNCCTDCCLVYKNFRQGGLSHIFTKSYYSPQMIDESKCVGCNLCGKYCPTEATYYDKINKKLIFDYQKCVGCGQCVNQCHFNVREMVRDERSVYVPAKKRK